MAPIQSAGSHNPPSNNLWIGNISHDVTDNELKELLESYGQIDSVASYPTRNYAFVYFRELGSAVSVKQGLQGHMFHGSPLKIEFAKPAKPCKTLWVSGIGSISREDLEKEFIKFGKIHEFRFLKERGTAFVDYKGLEDATHALVNMNGKKIGADQIRVDYLRSQASKREPGVEAKETPFFNRNVVSTDFRWNTQESANHHTEASLAETNKHQPLSTQPTRVLMISHPPSIFVEEDMLHNAMILFGEIEGITTFPDKNFAFVEFRSVEEAWRAKEGLQGKLFNNPKISIEYASEIPGVRGHKSQMGVLSTGQPNLAGSGILPPPAVFVRPPLGHHSTFDPHQGRMQNPSWSRSSPTPGAGMSPSGFNATKRPVGGAWDALDNSPLHRDSKRSRYDGDSPQGREDTWGGSSKRVVWRGLITKGGTPVCRAVCVPLGDGISADIPDVVNCSARTGLDMLSKHYEDAIGFDVVSFLPDSEEDFAAYTEFLRYLGSRDRAGVAKFDDGTTLFLVPPSDFLTQILKVPGPERLYGVVLRFPQAGPVEPAMNPQLINQQFADRNTMASSQAGYGVHHEERLFAQDGSRLPPKPLGPPTSISQTGLALTPELIATLTSLLPASNAGSAGLSVPQIPAMQGPTSTIAENNITQWNHEQQVVDHNGQFVQQFGSQMNPQLQHLPQPQPGQFYQAVNSYSQMHGRGPVNMPPVKQTAPVFPYQGGPSQQQYQQGSSHDVFRAQGSSDHGTDASRYYSAPPNVVQQHAYPPALSNQIHGHGVSQTQPYAPVPQLQQLPTDPSHGAAIQENAETEADKNERYKSTLLFAANLLSRIHQPQGSQQPGQGA